MKTIFISLDTVCADRLSGFGGKQVSTPNIDALAADGALFSQAFACDIPTQPSHTSVFTGRVGIDTGIVSHFHPPAHLSEEIPWLPSIFRRVGCRTAAVDHLFSMKEWFIRGYDDYLVPPGRSRSPGSVINELGMPWISSHRHDDFFLFLHYWDAHIPYVPPEPYKTRFTEPLLDSIDPFVMMKIRSRPSYPLFKRNLYDHLDRLPSLEYVEALHYAELAYLDHELGCLFDHLAELGILDECMIVMFGDHGEVMTEHDAWFDHAGLYDTVVHVPLVIRAPGVVPAQRVDAMVSLTDVAPTVLELQGVDDVDGMQSCDGISLVPLLTGRAVHHRDAVFLSECTWQAKRAIRTAEWKLIRCWDPGIYPRSGYELYDLRVDPLEQSNILSEHPRIAADLDDRLTSWIEEHLAGRPDPMVDVVRFGLPAVERLAGVIREDQEDGVRIINLREASESRRSRQLATS